MENHILSAIIGVVGTIVGAVSAGVVRDRLERRRSIFKNLPPARRDAISAHWVGNVDQEKGPKGESIEFPIEFYLSTNGTEVKGTGHFEWEDRLTELLILGGYIDDYYLKLEYKDADPMILRYGTIIFEISPDASTIEGWFVGYAAEMKGLIHGEIKMRKGGRLELSGR
jgi:hypothetical protein